ncbi:MAG: VanW family protein, partial [Clostridia bacterium]|nr:VanW family protein [Clostridia bacterium]
ANRINGKILMPGEEFSYDKTIGKRTVANGYREAGVYIGNKVESGIGGGICQTSSTLYSAALYANLEIVSRTSHSLPVSYVPAGQDATIAEGYIDLKLKNNTPYPVKIIATVSGRKLTCSILGVKDPEVTVELVHTRTANYEPQLERIENEEIPKGYKYVINKGASGYAVASQRIVKKSGKVEKTEKLTRSVYRAAPIEEEVNPADKDTPSEQLKNYTPGMIIPEEQPDVGPVEKPEIQTPEVTDTEQQPALEEEVEEEVNV